MKPFTYEELEKRVRELDHEYAVTAALSELYKPLVSPFSTIEEITIKLLEKALVLTGSKHGYISSINPDTGENVAHTLTQMLERCGMPSDKQRIAFPINPDGTYPTLWGHSLNTRESIYTNAPTKHPASTGLPPGHVPIERFLSVPVMLGEQLVGQVALANKKEDYTDRDLETTQRLAAYYALAIQRMRIEEEVQKARDQLEIRVRERTAELTAVNQQLSREIKERQHSEEALRQSSAQYKHLVENIPAILYLYSTKRGGIFYSPQVEAVLKYTVSHLYEHPHLWNQSIHPDDKDQVQKAISNFSMGKNFELVYRIKDAFGQWHWFHDHSTGRLVEGDDIIIEGLALDITEKKKAEEEREQLMNELRRAKKMEAIGTLAGGIAHDFNNILAAIIGYSELAQCKLSPDSEAISDLDEVLKASNRAKELVKQILTFSRHGVWEKKPIQIHRAVTAAVQLLRAIIPTNIQILQEIEPACENHTVLGDPNQVHQLIMNLGTNAYQAMQSLETGASAILKVTLTYLEIQTVTINEGVKIEPGKYIKIQVSDTGHGIDPEIIERIYDPYFTTRGIGEGSGLGLSVVHGIVKRHKGYITVDSQPGKGSTFSIYFPCH
ncbi:MAG: two-component system, cell cycle sensor histidine kinase and response regulator CckA [Acidobacteriota bacterium]|nr:two-component system, cell cycle sensor histidine kinase and response regulator CckA [Acidobacteriota bacterium]